jgi:hypothetical protein
MATAGARTATDARGPTNASGGRPAEPRRVVTPSRPPATNVDVARWTIVSVLLSLIGLLGLAALIYGVKFHGVRDALVGVPTRDIYVVLLGFIAAPLFLALFHRVSALFFLIPITTLVLLYPLFNPFGIPYSRDPIYNFQFASVLLQTGHWTPGAFVTQQAIAYSFYPASAVFNAEFATFTGLPLKDTFLVASPILHLLILPAALYTIGAQLFGPRLAWGGVLFYLGTPSILLNSPVEQEFALPFFVLTLMTLFLLATGSATVRAFGLRGAVVLFSSYVVLSHHLTSYILAAWLGLLVLVPYLLGGSRERGVVRVGSVRGKEVFLLTERSGLDEGPVRPGPMMSRYLLVFVLFSFFISAPILYHHLIILGQALGNVVQGVTPNSRVASVGQTFPAYQQVWIYLAIAVLLIVSFLAAREFLRDRKRRFLVTNLIIAGIATLATIPFLPTALGFLPLREMEFSIPVAAPALAWWLIVRFRPWLERFTARVLRSAPATLRRIAPTLGVLALAGLVFTGGSLVPVDVRDQLASPKTVLIDSPLHIDAAGYALSAWAHDHFNRTNHLWGDELAYSVFGGFGEFRVRYFEYQLFNDSNISDAAWHALGLGDYVVTDQYMTQTTPEFPGPANDQPTGPLTVAQVDKFNAPPYIDKIYQDSTFTIYEIMHKPKGL